MTNLEKSGVKFAQSMMGNIEHFTVGVDNETDTIWLFLHKPLMYQPLLMRYALSPITSLQRFEGHRLEVKYKGYADYPGPENSENPPSEGVAN